MPKSEYKRYLDAAVEAARAAGAIQLDRLGSSLDIRHKGESDLVTEVDVMCEERAREILLGRFPDHGFLAEESGGSAADECRWIVDPLDGTTNYAHAYPMFCASVALEMEGRVVAGAVFNPVSGELFTGELNAGAFLNGRRLSVSGVSRLEDAMGATGFSYDVDNRTGPGLEHFKRMLAPMQAIRRDGSAALNLCYVAAGRFDCFWELTLHPWDIAAGWLIIEEAGGRVTRMDGSPMKIDYPEIAASNGALHDVFIKTLNGK